MLHAPPRLHELGGEPVEQLGVRGRLAAATEVEDGRDERLVEVARPDVVHGYARSERVFA